LIHLIHHNRYRSPVALRRILHRLKRMKGCYLCGVHTDDSKWFRIRKGERRYGNFYRLSPSDLKKELKLCEPVCFDCFNDVSGEVTKRLPEGMKWNEYFYQIVERIKSSIEGETK